MHLTVLFSVHSQYYHFVPLYKNILYFQADFVLIKLVLYLQNLSLMFLIHVFLCAGVYCIQRNVTSVDTFWLRDVTVVILVDNSFVPRFRHPRNSEKPSPALQSNASIFLQFFTFIEKGSKLVLSVKVERQEFW